MRGTPRPCYRSLRRAIDVDEDDPTDLAAIQRRFLEQIGAEAVGSHSTLSKRWRKRTLPTTTSFMRSRAGRSSKTIPNTAAAHAVCSLE